MEGVGGRGWGTPAVITYAHHEAALTFMIGSGLAPCLFMAGAWRNLATSFNPLNGSPPYPPSPIGRAARGWNLPCGSYCQPKKSHNRHSGTLVLLMLQ